jgi:hypothetical protein
MAEAGRLVPPVPCEGLLFLRCGPAEFMETLDRQFGH